MLILSIVGFWCVCLRSTFIKIKNYYMIHCFIFRHPCLYTWQILWPKACLFHSCAQSPISVMDSWAVHLLSPHKFYRIHYPVYVVADCRCCCSATTFSDNSQCYESSLHWTKCRLRRKPYNLMVTPWDVSCHRASGIFMDIALHL